MKELEMVNSFTENMRKIEMNVDKILVINSASTLNELTIYKIIHSYIFVDELTRVIVENKLHDVVAEYIELARNVAKYVIYEDEDVIREIIQVNIMKELDKNGIEGIIDFLDSISNYIED